MPRIIPLAVCASLLAGCAASHIATIRQGSPNPLAGKTRFNVAPPDFTKTSVDDKPVAAWVAEGGSEEAKDWPLNTANATKEFFERLQEKKGAMEIATTGQATADEVLITPSMERIEPGLYAVVFSKPTRIKLHVNISVNGQAADEIVITEEESANIYKPSFNQRLANCMQAAAQHLTGYLKERSK